ncbi:hypothetical protein [Mucilaginibacter pocheonensis]|uniref:hypothetical protein n=1 Tax=Mucilaginibacter pocheonensis TaxID=398050 RepID=UPI0035B56678
MISFKQRIDMIAPWVIAIVMISLFCWLSEGWSLIVTFVPAVPVAVWLYFKTCYYTKPEPAAVLTLYLVGVGFQLLHFAEEHAFGFEKQFGVLFGGQPYNHNLFVTFNMAAYFMFILGAIGFYKGIRPFMFFGLFFIVYGMIGNAVGHIGFCFAVGGYFPGIYTCFFNLFVGIVLIRKLFKYRPALDT